MIAIVDYGRGNLGSVEKAITRLGERALVTQDPREVERADALILPGDGAFHDAMRNLEVLNLTEPLKQSLRDGKPFLGICLGYQLLFSESEEFGQGKGLDLIPGVVRRFPRGLKVPHMGWNQVEHRGEMRILDGIPSGAYFYFVHSYYPEPAEDGLSVATCSYGVTFPAAITKANLFGTQFHPEKSQTWGLKLLENFTRLVKGNQA
ncbi:MAG TPA: imidazole glycerol phosphate synthase subunit HisH [Methylomirabilota bacterium]|nr:imidazole glycerol phosphate synthase subunit HisH [Methylomirabilota bacterium]